MNGFPDRYDRNIRLFGEEGQHRLRETKAAVVGIGGLGSPLVQQLALLGVEQIALIDDEELDNTNRNRFIGARYDDPVPGSKKVMLAARMIGEINPDVATVPHETILTSPEAFEAIREADWVFGCFDEDGPRAILNEVCAAYVKPYIDMASDVPEGGIYGGRVCVAWDGNGCMHCLGVLDPDDVRRYLASESERQQEDAMYGIPRGTLDQTGPSVAPVNGVIATLAATEFMAAVTGMREPTRLMEYRGHLSKIMVIQDDPQPNCPYCNGILGKPESANVERYLEIPHLQKSKKQ